VHMGVAGAFFWKGLERFGAGLFHERVKDGFAFNFLTVLEGIFGISLNHNSLLKSCSLSSLLRSLLSAFLSLCHRSLSIFVFLSSVLVTLSLLLTLFSLTPLSWRNLPLTLSLHFVIAAFLFLCFSP
jgi:hypothetical protein